MTHDGKENLSLPIPISRMAQAQSLRDVAYTWYALSLACKRIGAMIERAAKEILHAPTDNHDQPSEGTDDNSN